MRRRRAHIEAMSNAPQMAEVAALVGDPARANILCALLGGRALTPTELALTAAGGKRPVFCPPWVGWTERRSHIGGAVGAALAKRCFELKWLEQMRDSRALTITPAGRRGLMDIFDLSI